MSEAERFLQVTGYIIMTLIVILGSLTAWAIAVYSKDLHRNGKL